MHDSVLDLFLMASNRWVDLFLGAPFAGVKNQDWSIVPSCFCFLLPLDVVDLRIRAFDQFLVLNEYLIFLRLEWGWKWSYFYGLWDLFLIQHHEILTELNTVKVADPYFRWRCRWVQSTRTLVIGRMWRWEGEAFPNVDSWLGNLLLQLQCLLTLPTVNLARIQTS